MRSHGVGHDARTLAEEQAVRATRRRPAQVGSMPDTVLALQRSIGNRATTALLQRRKWWQFWKPKHPAPVAVAAPAPAPAPVVPAPGAQVQFGNTSVSVRGSGANSAQFVQTVLQHLTDIQNAIGAQFFTDLAVPGKKQVVVPVGAAGNSQCVGTSMGNKKLRKMHEVGTPGPFGQELTATLQAADQANAGVSHDAAWLTTQLRATPLPRWSGLTDAAPIAPFATQPATSAKVAAWLAGQAIPSIDEMDVLMLVLEPWAANGPGAHSRIEYDHTKTALSTGPRPPAVGLFHELIHAFHNARGSNLGREDSIKETNGGRLYECMAVGLGPFAGRPYTENAMRATLGPPFGLRPSY